MPKISGVDAACAIKPDLPVIFMTGYDKEQSLDPENRPAGSIVMKKPFSAACISRELRALLDQ